MTTAQIILLVAGLVVAEFLFAWFVIGHLMRSTIGSLAEKFPAVEPAPDAVRKDFQSFRFGLINAGYSVHVAADEQHLHLTPAKLLRLLGAKPASVPWNEIELTKPGNRYSTAKIGTLTITGPTWCLGLADQGEKE